MKMENGIFEENYVTSFSQTGIRNVLTNKSFLSLLEIHAAAHSAYCNFSFEDLAKDNLSWIILSWKMQVFKRPKADEKITIQTWGRDFNKIFVQRDFKVMGNDRKITCYSNF